ncbi:uncharacterized protein [Rutidosis leptorrhynchoides]|uniref:uncharacterized protein n=1 Tax=Rutidosis leptorrhynchoides TaxID=125765 RepID=UPI003A990FDA
MAVSSASLQSSLYSSSSSSKFCFVRSDKFNQRNLVSKTKGRSQSACVIKSVINNNKSSINDDEAVEPARILLERLFVQSQKLEEKIGKDSNGHHDIELVLNLGKLESDLQSALTVLRKKEEDLEAAENDILSEYIELNQAKEELSKREEVVKSNLLKLEELENGLKQANLDLASQAAEIKNLKLQLEKQDKEVTTAQSAILLKEIELNVMVEELRMKSEVAENTESELRSKSKLLNETKEILSKQTVEIQELRETLQQKDEKLQTLMTRLGFEEEKVKDFESNLEKQTMDWLVAQEEMKTLTEEASKHTVEVNVFLEEFTNVKKLLDDVRSELISSQKSLTLSRKKMEDQQEILEKDLSKLEQHRESVFLYAKSLKNAEVEVESERIKLGLAEARNQELERDLSMDKDLISELQNCLNEEKLSLKQATEELLVVRDELDRKTLEYGSMQNVLESKESELVEAKLEIQRLKSEQSFLDVMLKEKESELFDAQKMLSEVNQEILNLKTILINRESELTEATMMLNERDEQVETIQHDLNETNLKYSETTSVVESIVELTNKIVSSIKKDDYISSKEKQLETELDVIRETLRSREREVLQTQRALTIKENELKIVSEKLNEQEKEMNEMKYELTHDADDLKKLYAAAQDQISEENIGELAIEKLELEAAQLEVQAATSALQTITDMSRELLRTTSLVVDVVNDLDVPSTVDVHENEMTVSEDRCFDELKAEVSRLSEFTQKLIQEAGINGDLGVIDR